ncbi:aminotransferase class I/II-fold pyridoxal phosphate-dependent enzyme [Dongia soli]|uniref:Aminotransferase class I/II-fold pyridoxal phosphate-dependent enzyme n=1 Tax=Dongia soli TaxID=600628 RepID=A0ABU5E6X7_9PROT|nr:aminotransferase class I/II-fold pyridoxal phosphate-dependent enzyme [Dongia soli]MDY0882045.1 aminotransferase class I/II-fold pyridoxal phosphate-dependent enzyme [Dongia soli]
MKFHPFTRLNKLLENVTPGGGNTPFLLSVGEPQFAPPDFVSEIIAAEAGSWGKYPQANGNEAFRQAVKDWTDKRYGLPTGMLQADQHILPVAGTREALFHIALSAVPEYGPESTGGERPIVLMPNPFYHVYAGAAAAAGAEPCFLPARAETNFLPVIADIPPAILKRTALAYLCSPANPQGTVADLDYLKAWLALARRHDFVLASDECYAEIYLHTPPPGALSAARDLGGELDHLLVFHSLSKRSSGAGLRSGFVAGDANLIRRQTQLVNFGGVAQPYPILAAATALWRDEDHVIANRRRYQANFALAQEILGPLFGEVRSAGGFFLWLDVGDGERAAVELWRRAAIKVLPGGYMARPDAAGENPGQRYIRVALVYEPADMKPVLKRLAAVLADFLTGNGRRDADRSPG